MNCSVERRGAAVASGPCKVLAAAVLCLLLAALNARGQATQPLVAIHDSELTRALETMPASGGTPTGPGTTGFQWWPTNWHYFVMPDAVKEMLRSDGTAFTNVSDAAITAGALVATNGQPNFPILISLASEAIRDDEIGPLTNYVAAGGFLFIGSSSFTRMTNGNTRGDFALASQMGIHMVNASLQNWAANSTFTRVSENPIVAHIPPGQITWQMPSSSEEISWPEANHIANPPTTLPHLIWQVQPGGATILAQGDSRPYMFARQYGKGWFIYDAAMQPVIGHGGWAPGMYAYGVFRNAIQWAFQASRLPVPKTSPWPYAYDAAVVFRHDMESLSNLIAAIEGSAQFEFTNGAKGDYFFCTGALRQNIGNPGVLIASLQRAVSNYSATVASHNGGLTNLNFYIPPLDTNSYDYWHWGPDEVLDLNPAGYANGAAYAQTSISNSLQDIQGWIPGTNNGGGLKLWVAPYFNATREASYQMQQQLGIQVTGDQKAGPFPHWTISTQTPDKLYPFVTLPVSDWFIGPQIGQAMEEGHTTNSVHALVDFYYNYGALINLYSHSSSVGNGDAGGIASEYVLYSLAKPKIWSANAAGIYSWWLQRSNMQITPVYSTNSTQGILSFTITGTVATNAAVEALLPITNWFGLQVRTNGTLAGGTAFRTNAQVVKVQVTPAITTVEIRYSLQPVAQNDYYTTTQGTALSVPAPGVLTNDMPGTASQSLTAALVSAPTRGTLTLTNNGGFRYTPTNNLTGVDNFTYRASDNKTNSLLAANTCVMVKPAGDMFFDTLLRPTNATSLLPWVQQLGTPAITNGLFLATSGSNSYGHSYYFDNTLTDYVVQARVQFSSTSGFGGGVGGRLDPTSGAHYAAWVYPENSLGGSAVMKLVKFEQWAVWSFHPMATASLPGVGTNAHIVTLSLQGNQLTAYYDGVQQISVTDTGFDSVPAYTSGGISLDMFTYPVPYTLAFNNVIVAATNAPLIMVQPLSETNLPGTTATFTVTALGPSLSYQWFKGASAISGATGTALTLTNLVATNAANYTVVVSNTAASATSAIATLTVTDPIITSQPVSETNNAGTTANFTVSAIGDSTLGYQWYKNGVQMTNGGKYSGVTSATLSISGVLAVDVAGYTVVVTNAAGSVTSAPPAQLTVVDPFITAQPVTRTNNAGTLASFSVTAGGTAPLTYQWFFNATNALGDSAHISGSSSATLWITNVGVSDEGGYSVLVTNVVGGVTSAPAALFVINSPVINSVPPSRTNNAGTVASFTVTATGGSPLTYQWFKNVTNSLSDGGKIFGSSSSALTILNLLGTDAGSYTLVITNQAGKATSAPPTVLTVIDPVITNQPASTTNPPGSTATFTVGVAGTSPQYQWFKGASLINGATASAFSLSGISNGNAGTYSVVVSNVFGSATSSNAVLTVGGPFMIQSVVLSNGVATITWSSFAGLTYRAQFTGTLLNTSNNWTNIVPDILASGSTAFTTNATVNTTQRFYRVLQLP